MNSDDRSRDNVVRLTSALPDHVAACMAASASLIGKDVPHRDRYREMVLAGALRASPALVERLTQYWRARADLIVARENAIYALDGSGHSLHMAQLLCDSAWARYSSVICSSYADIYLRLVASEFGIQIAASAASREVHLLHEGLRALLQ